MSLSCIPKMSKFTPAQDYILFGLWLLLGSVDKIVKNYCIKVIENKTRKYRKCA